jgi:hypothetical protein
MIRHGLCAAVAAAVLCTGVMAAKASVPGSSHEDTWNDLSEKFRKYHSDHTNIFFHLITTPLGVLSVLSVFNKATNTNMLTKALAVVYCLHIMDKMPLHILATTSFVATGLAMAAANTASLSYIAHLAVLVLCHKLSVIAGAWACGRLSSAQPLLLACPDSMCLQMFVVGYFGQDAAHFFTGEQT